MSPKKLKIIDLFCGCGGFSLGAARAGFSLVGAIDNDARALAAHGVNFPNCKHSDRDISKLSAAKLRDLFALGDNEIDGVIGGPPCQGFSVIGRREDSDPRNGLFIRFFRLVSELRPTFFLSENVPGIMHPDYDPVRASAFRHVKKDYNLLPPMRLRASDYGAPTTRLRVFFLGIRKDVSLNLTPDDFLPSASIVPINVGAALKGLPRKIRDDWQKEAQGWRKVGVSHNGAFGKRLSASIPKGMGNADAITRLAKEKRVSGCLGTRHTQVVVNRFSNVKPGSKDDISKCVRLDPKGFCPTLRAGTGSERGSFQAVRPLHPTENRVITPREAARLQGFPDWFQFDATKWHSFRQIGNSVSPILAELLLTSIRARMDKRSA